VLVFGEEDKLKLFVQKISEKLRVRKAQ
jgi:hypothetical protein